MSIKMKYIGEITDPIHKHIKFTDLEKQIIDTSIFQRLRRIKQLAGAHLVYPSAQHSRFEHSIGAMHLAGVAGEHFFIKGDIRSSESIQELRVASLLHDIGHGPFSHLFEELLRINGKKDHELIGAELILKSEISDILNKFGFSPVNISKLSFGESAHKFKNEVIAGSLSSDLMDYLPRDSFFTGAEYGKIDSNRIINSFRLLSEGGIALDISALYSFESMIISRYQMFRSVYFHKTVRSVEVMLLNSMLMSDKVLNFSNLSLDDYLELTDENVIYRIISLDHDVNRKSKELIKNYVHRKLLKCVYERFIQRKEKKHLVTDRKKLEQAKIKISDMAKVKEENIFLDASGISSVPLAANKQEMKSILLINEEESFKKPVSEIPLINSISGYLDMLRVYTDHKYRGLVGSVSKKILEDEGLTNT